MPIVCLKILDFVEFVDFNDFTPPLFFFFPPTLGGFNTSLILKKGSLKNGLFDK
jgi:hypothetical protein